MRGNVTDCQCYRSSLAGLQSGEFQWIRCQTIIGRQKQSFKLTYPNTVTNECWSVTNHVSQLAKWFCDNGEFIYCNLLWINDLFRYWYTISVQTEFVCMSTEKRKTVEQLPFSVTATFYEAYRTLILIHTVQLPPPPIFILKQNLQITSFSLIPFQVLRWFHRLINLQLMFFCRCRSQAMRKNIP